MGRGGTQIRSIRVPPRPILLTPLLEQGLDVGVGVERFEVFELLADADELYRQADLAFDAEDGAALRRAIQLRQDDPRTLYRLLEVLRLDDGVLTAGGVEDEQLLVRGAGHGLADDAIDLLQLAHQVCLRVQSAGGVNDQNVKVARLRLLAGIVGDAGRIAALLALDDLAAGAFDPDGQLLDRRGAERIAGGDQYLLALL